MILWMESNWVPEVLWVAASILLDVTELHHLLQEVWVAIIPMGFHGMVQGLASLLLLSQQIGDQILHITPKAVLSLYDVADCRAMQGHSSASVSAMRGSCNVDS